MVQFEPVAYSVTEGEQGALRVVLNFATSEAVTVDITTEDDSATTGSRMTIQLAIAR